MSKDARRKSRRAGLKRGHRRERGTTPGPRVRVLRDALTPDDARAITQATQRPTP